MVEGNSDPKRAAVEEEKKDVVTGGVVDDGLGGVTQSRDWATPMPSIVPQGELYFDDLNLGPLPASFSVQKHIDDANAASAGVGGTGGLLS